MHDPILIADKFISLSNQEGKLEGGFGLLKLMKLIYLAHGFKLGFFEDELVNELPQARKYGPIFERVFKVFSSQSGDITEKANRLIAPSFSNSDLTVIKQTFDVYKNWKPWQLVELTHENNSPWHNAWEKSKRGKIKGQTIDNDEIKQYFKERYFPSKAS